MIIKYKKSRIRYNLIFAGLLILVGIVGFVIAFDSLFSSAWLLMGVAQLSIGYFEMKKQYLTISEQAITKNSIIPKTLKFQDILKIKRFKGVYKIETASTKMVIDKFIIENKSLLKLNEKIENLETTL
ncbi:hypothetical protein [Gillisia marina]|uniref:hypothetical protein n=1 Tax=Gillisia marina TaxID=1167637 RepID=UPI00029ACE3C|nr:hypothetical protein [Gillisia marina]